MKVSYNHKQVTLAAQFLWANNPGCSYWPEAPKNADDVETSILNHIRRQVRLAIAEPESERWHYVSTGGYTILLWKNSEDTIDVEVTVDPGVAAFDGFAYLVKDPSIEW